MDFSTLFGWLLINVAVPILAPIAFLPLLGAGKTYRGRVRELIMASIRGGQLFWTAIVMCAAASYKAAVYMSEMKGEEISLSRAIAWTAIGWHIALIIISAVLIVLRTMHAVDNEGEAATLQSAEGADQVQQITVVSIWMLVATAVSFTATHFWAS
jgi:hypothetical protein